MLGAEMTMLRTIPCLASVTQLDPSELCFSARSNMTGGLLPIAVCSDVPAG